MELLPALLIFVACWMIILKAGFLTPSADTTLDGSALLDLSTRGTSHGAQKSSDS